MEDLLARLKDRVPGLEWLPPPLGMDGHALAWDGGRHEEERLGELVDWANGKWPA